MVKLIMTKKQILAALQESWWTLSIPNLWCTEFVSASILFNTLGLNDCVYFSSAPYQTNGLNSGVDNWNGYLTELIESLMIEASQRLEDMHCTEIVGPQVNNRVNYVFGAVA